MKRILLVSLVGALLSTNLFGQNFAQFRAAYKAKKGNAELVRIFKAMTNANDKQSARTLVKNIDTLVAQADTAAVQAKIEQQQPQVVAAEARRRAAQQAAAPMAPRPPSDEGLFEQQGGMSGFEEVPVVNPVVVAPVAPAAARPTVRPPLPPTPAVAPAAAQAVPASELKTSQEEMSVAATALINILQSGALSSQDMNAALKTFTQNFPRATNIVKEAQALIDKKRTEEQAGKADAEVKTSVAAFLALNAYEPLNKKIEDATLTGMKFSQAQAQEVTKHINSLATLSAAEKSTLITSLEPLL